MDDKLSNNSPILPNRLTDNEIKKALDVCGHTKGCTNCPLGNIKIDNCQMLLTEGALDLINRYEAKIEQLEKQHIEDDKLLNDRVQEAVNSVSKANQKYVDSLEKAFNDRTAEKQNLEFENKELKAENERLENRNIKNCRNWQAKYNHLKVDSYKEFAEACRGYGFGCESNMPIRKGCAFSKYNHT